MTTVFGNLIKRFSGVSARMSPKDLQGCPFMAQYAKQHAMEAIDETSLAKLASHCPALRSMQKEIEIVTGVEASVESVKPVEMVLEPSAPTCQKEPKLCETAQKLLKALTYESQVQTSLYNLKKNGRYRTFANLRRQVGSYPRAVFHPEDPEAATYEVEVMCSNDYLGMGHHPAVRQACKAAVDDVGAGAGGTRNIAGSPKYHVELENKLAELHGKERALVFSSGYVANEAALSAMGQIFPDALILSDKENHASMIA